MFVSAHSHPSTHVLPTPGDVYWKWQPAVCFSVSPVPVRGSWIWYLMSRGFSHTHSLSRVLLSLCVCSADHKRHAAPSPRANCCYWADSLSVLHSHWLPGLQGDSCRHPKTNKLGRTINNGCKSYSSAQLLIKIRWECVSVSVLCKSVKMEKTPDCPCSVRLSVLTGLSLSPSACFCVILNSNISVQSRSHKNTLLPRSNYFPNISGSQQATRGLLVTWIRIVNAYF